MARWLSWLERRPVTAEVDGSNRSGSFAFYNAIQHMQFGVLAQLGEHLPYKQRVTGSSPVGPFVLYLHMAVSCSNLRVWWNRQTQGT